MLKQKIIFRVDGNSKIGLGHISRCCALADMLKDEFEIYFYTRADSKPVINDVKRYCIDVFQLNENITYEEEASQWISFLKGNEIVVLDGYNFNTTYQKKIKDKGCKLVCIDDIHAYHFIADAVINHAPGVNANQYSVEPYTKLYLGTEYVLLKKIFLDEAAVQKKTFNLKTSPVLICFGGADANNITKEVLEKTIHLFPGKKINVVVGAAYIHLDELNKIIKEQQHVSLYINVKPEEMLALMQQSGIAIIAASTIALEYICVKGNLFLKQTADNQKNLYDSLIEKKCAYHYELLNDQDNSNEIISNQYKLIDGKSDERLRNIFLDLRNDADICSIILNTATEEDLEIYFTWANDPGVRSQAYSTEPIKFEDHKKWFEGKLHSENSLIFIFKACDKKIGQVRFDILENNTALIDYSVDKNFRNKGFGSRILQMAIKKFKEKYSIPLVAHVKFENFPSRKIFEKLSFKIYGQVEHNNQIFIIYKEQYKES